MTITVREDEDASGGYAFLDLGRKFDRSQPRISIRRLNAEPRHLGLEGWQFEPAWLEPEASINNGGATVLRLAPQIIDQIEELVRIEISVEGEGTIGQVTWPDITPSPQSILGISLEATPPHKKAPEPAEIVTPAAELARPFNPDQDIMIAIAEAVFTPPVVEPRLPRPAPRRRRFPRALLALIVVGCALGAVQLLKPGLLCKAYEDIMARLNPPNSTSQLPIPGPASPSSEEMSRRYATMLTNGGTVTNFLEFGREALQTGNGQVAFRAFEEANPTTNEDAAWELARFYDPRNDDAVYRAVARRDAARAA
ncbi:MAG TPA: hypothetical protein VK638_34920, partial [Edaphobacter sp.]|nr:hypothetical protein [Edaphobacter sp.]